MVSFRPSLLSSIIIHALYNVDAADFSTILTETVFNELAPSATAPYTYAGFVAAVNTWNTNNQGYEIFSGSTEMKQRHELAAFFGNTLHESDAFKASREYFMCESNIDVNSDLYCSLPSNVFTLASHQYCSTNHQNPASGGYEDGCNCSLESADSEQGGTYVLANKLYFGRGAIQLSWNYNYIDASKALTGGNTTTLCQEPELVATDPAYAWGTALWFWTMNTGSVGKTCRDAVLTDGDFGGTVNTINGGVECPTADGYAPSLAQRLNYYCQAATALSIDALLTFDDCSGMKNATDTCAVVDGACESCLVWTASPTSASPSASPSKSPSLSPSVSPAAPVTPSPSKAPITPSPSAAPVTSSPSTAAPVTPSPSATPTTASPSIKPTLKPTNQPVSAAPTRSGATGKYYPNWSSATGPHVCLLDDGSLIVPGGAPLYTDKSTCCSHHYSWNLNLCNDIVTGPSNKYFPNWDGTPNVCLLDDGTLTLPSGAPLYVDISTCCSTHYSWNLNQCMGAVLGPSNDYFPNWGGAPDLCVQDDGSHTVPDGVPYYATLTDCCSHHYSWKLNECSGVVTQPTNLFFPDWNSSTGTCLKDNGMTDVPEYMSSNPTVYMHATGADCCQIAYSWRYTDCVANLP